MAELSSEHRARPCARSRRWLLVTLFVCSLLSLVAADGDNDIPGYGAPDDDDNGATPQQQPQQQQPQPQQQQNQNQNTPTPQELQAQRQQEEERRRLEEERKRQEEAARQQALEQQRRQQEEARRRAEEQRRREEFIAAAKALTAKLEAETKRNIDWEAAKRISQSSSSASSAASLHQRLSKLHDGVRGAQAQLSQAREAMQALRKQHPKAYPVTLIINTDIQHRQHVVHPDAGKQTNYLEHTLDSIFAQQGMDNLDIERFVQIVLVNNAKDSHPAFDAAKAKYNTRPNVRFIDNSQTIRKLVNERASQPLHTELRRRQLENLVASLDALLDDTSHNYLLLDADEGFRMCPNALRALQYLVHKSAPVHPDYAALRVAHGGANGILFQSRDMGALLAYLRPVLSGGDGESSSVPPVHVLLREWITASSLDAHRYFYTSRRLITFRYNLFHRADALAPQLVSNQLDTAPADLDAHSLLVPYADQDPAECWSPYTNLVSPDEEHYIDDTQNTAFDISFLRVIPDMTAAERKQLRMRARVKQSILQSKLAQQRAGQQNTVDTTPQLLTDVANWALLPSSGINLHVATTGKVLVHAPQDSLDIATHVRPPLPGAE